MGPNGPVMSATFELEGQGYYAFNGGPMFTFTEAISLFVSCDTQIEIDMYWEKLSEGGKKAGADGSKINSVFPGRSYLPS